MNPRRSVPPRLFFPLLGMVLGLLILAACSSPTTGPTAKLVLPNATIGGDSGIFRTDSPSADTSAPAAMVAGADTIIPGGSATFTVTAAEEFTQLFVWLGSVGGFYEFTMPANTMQRVVVTFSPNLPDDFYSLIFAVGNGDGAGPSATADVGVERVGTGDLQVSVSWDSPADLDLYLIEPDGTEIYYGSRISMSGGELDLDSNAACYSDDVRNENITYENAAPPVGQYTVRLNHWSNCDATETNWVITLRVEGQPVRTFEGTYTGEGVFGGLGDGDVITTFNFP